jgi:hypothetical protein
LIRRFGRRPSAGYEPIYEPTGNSDIEDSDAVLRLMKDLNCRPGTDGFDDPHDLTQLFMLFGL